MRALVLLLVFIVAVAGTYGFYAFATVAIPAPVQVHMASIATCEINDEKFAYTREGFAGTKIWEWWMARLFRLRETYLDGPLEYVDSSVGSHDVISILEIASTTTNGKCDEEILELAEIYLQRGADINANFHGFTPLHSAIFSRNLGYFKFLLERGANTEAIVKLTHEPYSEGTALELVQHLRERRDDIILREMESILSKKSNKDLNRAPLAALRSALDVQVPQIK